MSEFPTCQEHKVLKPCVHCEPSKYAPAAGTQFAQACGDIYKGAKLVTCSCGCVRAIDRDHGHTDNSNSVPWYI